MRVERGTALLAALYANAHSKNGGHKISDFAPYHDEPVVTLDQAMGAWE